MLGNTKYSFWWTPKPVNGRRSTRAQKGTPTEPYRNVMYDKRVVRGSNYGATSIELDTYKAAEWRRRNMLRKKVLTRNQRNVIGTPPPVMGRRHEFIQTDKYLEELLEHPPVRTTDTQTDLFLEPPPTPPPFVGGKIGIDVGTCIEPGDLELQQEQVATKGNDEELPLIERFIEACIAETAQEVELETVDTTIEDTNKITAISLLQGHVAEILPDVLEKFEDPQTDATKREQLLTSLCPGLGVQEADGQQIVDSQEILSVIIEEIIKQHGEACAAAVVETIESVEGSAIEEEESNDGS